MRPSTSVASILPAFAAFANAASSTTPTSIFAYGPGIGGLPIFSSGGDIFFGNFSLTNDTEAAPIIITPGDSTWSASPNTTGFASGQNPTWSNRTFSVPGPSSSSHNVTLLNGTADTSDVVTSFMFYGSWVMVDEDGSMTSLFYGEPSGTDGIYSLGWNSSDDASSSDKVLVTLKKTPPSNPKSKSKSRH